MLQQDEKQDLSHGIHYDSERSVALCGMETEEYQKCN